MEPIDEISGEEDSESPTVEEKSAVSTEIDSSDIEDDIEDASQLSDEVVLEKTNESSSTIGQRSDIVRPLSQSLGKALESIHCQNSAPLHRLEDRSIGSAAFPNSSMHTFSKQAEFSLNSVLHSTIQPCNFRATCDKFCTDDPIVTEVTSAVSGMVPPKDQSQQRYLMQGAVASASSSIIEQQEPMQLNVPVGLKVATPSSGISIHQDSIKSETASDSTARNIGCDTGTASALEAPASAELLEQLTMHQLKLVLQKRSTNINSSKAQLVSAALSVGVTVKEANEFDTKLRAQKKASNSVCKRPWSKAHRDLYESAPRKPKPELMLQIIGRELHHVNGMFPVTCDSCCKPGMFLELVQTGDRPFVGCTSFYAADAQCGNKMSIVTAYVLLEERRRILLELQSDTSFLLRVHRDFKEPLMSSLRLTPIETKLQGLVFPFCNYCNVVEGVRRLCGSATPHNLVLREVPQCTLRAVKRAQMFDNEAASGASDIRTQALKRLKTIGLWQILQEHQRQFVDWALLRRRVLCADDMGLGKSLQALALMVALDAHPTIIICPAFARASWASQIEQWGIARPGEYHVIHCSSSSLPNNARVQHTPKVVVVSYTMLQRQFQPIQRRQWKGIIVDESHKIGTSKRSENDLSNAAGAAGGLDIQATLNLLSSVSQETPIVLLSGTPAWTSTFDVYNQVELLCPGVLGKSKWDFARDYFRVHREPLRSRRGYFTLCIGSCERPTELNYVLTRTLMIRRRRCEVLHSLPQLQIIEAPTEIKRTHVSSVVSKFQVCKDASGMWQGVATAWERTGLCKAHAATELLREKLESAAQSGEAFIIFVRHHRVREAIECFLDTEMPGIHFVSLFNEHREKALLSFTAGSCNVAICMVESCGVAIDLSRASICMFIELPHTASEFNQAIARLHRQGQRCCVTAYVVLSRLEREAREHSESQNSICEEIHEDSLRHDRKHWVLLGKKAREAMQVLGDPCLTDKTMAEVSERQAMLVSPSKPKEVHKCVAELCQHCQFLISSETHRLHVYDSDGVHVSLFSRAPVVAGIPLDKDDLVKCGSALSSEVDVSSELLQAANDYVVTHAGLSPNERRLLVNSGPGGMPVPSEAGRLLTLVQTLRTPMASSTRRFAEPTTTQQVQGVGTHWARIEVKCRYGPLSYRQRVDMPQGTRYCIECQSELMDGGPMPELRKLEDEHQGNEMYLIRSSCISDLFCCGNCRQTYFVKRGSLVRKELVALEGGVCRKCGVDTDGLRERVRRLSSVDARKAFFTPTGCASDSERAMFMRLTTKRQEKLLNNPKGSHWWEADHVQAVADGGGESSLLNFQTLCLSCHQEKTQVEAKRRRELKGCREKRKSGNRKSSRTHPLEASTGEKLQGSDQAQRGANRKVSKVEDNSRTEPQGRNGKRKLGRRYQLEANVEEKLPGSDQDQGLLTAAVDHVPEGDGGKPRVRRPRWKKLCPMLPKDS